MRWWDGWWRSVLFGSTSAYRSHQLLSSLVVYLSFSADQCHTYIFCASFHLNIQQHLSSSWRFLGFFPFENVNIFPYYCMLDVWWWGRLWRSVLVASTSACRSHINIFLASFHLIILRMFLASGFSYFYPSSCSIISTYSHNASLELLARWMLNEEATTKRASILEHLCL